MADRSVLVRIRGDANDLIRAAAAGRAAISGLRKEIDTTNDRTAWMAQGFLALAPALAPLGAAAVPLLAGLAAQMTVAGTAAIATGLAFNGVGDATKALNEYELEPTAENFAKLQQAMDKIGPAGEEFVRFLDEVGPKFSQLQMAAREGMFPGMEDGIDHLVDMLPQLEDVIFNVSQGVGELASDAGEGLSGEGFAAFFDYLERDAKPILLDMGHTLGNFAEGLANMMVAFGPMTADFSGGFRDMSESFADWAAGLEGSASFAEFVDYINRAAPMVLDMIGSLADAFVQVLEAAAPVGDVMIPALSALFDIIAAIANTPLGTIFIAAAAGMSAYGRAVALAKITTGGLVTNLLGLDKGFGATLRGADGAIARMGAIKRTAGLAAGGVGMLALSMTDLDEKAGISNTAMGALLGTMIAPGWGTAIGAVIGGTMDLAAANDELEDAVTRAEQALDSGLTSALRRSRDELTTMLRDTEQGFTLDAFWDDLTGIGDDSNFGTAAMNTLTGASDKAKDALRDVNGALRQSGGAADLLAGPLGLTGEAFRTAARDADEFRESVGRAFAMLDRRAALRAARAAIRDFNAELKDAPDNMREGSAAYDQVQEALDDIARSSLEAAEHMRGMNRVNFLDRQRDAFIASARQMGLTSKRARTLADDFGLLDKTKVKPEVDGDIRPISRKLNQARDWMDDWGREKASATADADNRPARNKIGDADKWLTILGGRTVDPKIDVKSNSAAVAAQTNSDLNSIADEEVWITTRRRGTGMGAVGGADGMTVPGSRYPYGDKVFTHLAPGEEVISNRFGQADRHRALLKAINAGMADGGTVERRQFSAPRHSVGGGTRVIERTVERLPETIALDAGELGVIVINTVDDRIGDHNASASRPATHWNGITRD